MPRPSPALRAICAAVLLLAGLVPAAKADVAGLLDRQILPAHDAFARQATALADAARDGCDPQALIPAFHAAHDGWMAIQHLRIGPVEEEGRGMAIAFWPDPKGQGLRAQMALLTGDPARLAPGAFAQQSVAARGLSGLERLLFPSAAPASPWPAPTCPLIRATATDLARMATELRNGWRGDFGPALLTAGAPGNTRYLAPSEARQAMFTQIVTGLEHLRDQRLGRPLGSFDRPAPERAEARASRRSLRNVILSLRAIRDMATALSDGAAPRTLAALDRAVMQAEALDDPVLAGAATPQGRLRIEILHQSVGTARQTALDEMGPALGVGLGFNAMDGD